jgi:heme A synthase
VVLVWASFGLPPVTTLSDQTTGKQEVSGVYFILVYVVSVLMLGKWVYPMYRSVVCLYIKVSNRSWPCHSLGHSRTQISVLLVHFTPLHILTDVTLRNLWARIRTTYAARSFTKNSVISMSALQVDKGQVTLLDGSSADGGRN